MVTPDHINWQQYDIDPWWHQEHQNLVYVNEPFNDAVSLTEWQRLGYTQTRFTGDMYDMRNPEPEWLRPFRDIFLWQHFSWSLYCMRPGCVLPEHRDTYTRFKQIHDITNPSQIYRAVIFLEDWQSGHYFEIDRTPVTQWRKGHCVVWQNDVAHIAANVGSSNRFTLQITGVSISNGLDLLI
jgi:hypothetical protein